MNYEKPELVLVGPAVGAIESMIKPDVSEPDSDNKPTDPAYHSDE